MFVTFEGPEGGGKSTALKAVAHLLEAQGHRIVCTREPGATALGAKIRDLLLHGEDLAPETELFLFLADRSNHVQTVIRPALAERAIVLCDRFTDSTLVYQGYARDLDRDFIRQGNYFATGSLEPDLTVLFDLPAELGLSRLVSKDRLDAEPLEFHQRVREGFLDLARRNQSRWNVVDATKDPQTLAELVFSLLINRLQAADANVRY